MPTYIIRAGENGPVKIGKAGSVQDRLAELQSGNHERLSVLRVVDARFDTERAFHVRFKDYHIHGEWFRFCDEMLTFVPLGYVVPGRSKDRELSVASAARDEARDLLRETYRLMRDSLGLPDFYAQVASLLGVSDRRAKALYHREARRIEVHEIEGIRSFAASLRSADASQRA